MMTKSAVERIIDRCKCSLMPHWRVKLTWSTVAASSGDRQWPHTTAFIQIAADHDTCAKTGVKIPGWTGRKWLISPHMVESEIVYTVFKAYEAAIDHELRERFTYLDATIFDPHRSVGLLVEMCHNPEALDTRRDQLAG